MESLQSIKARLKAAKNIGQITKAMEVVAATKMRKAQETALNSRPYAFEALHLLSRIVHNTNIVIPLTEERPVKKTLVMIVASDKGLAGPFNSQAFRLADHFFATDEYVNDPSHEYLLVPVGKKTIGYVAKKKFKVVQEFRDFGDITKPEEIAHIRELLVTGFIEGKWDRVITISTHFHTALRQEPLMRQILPVSVAKIKETVREIVPEAGRYSDLTKMENGALGEVEDFEYIYEPSDAEVLKTLIPHLVEMQFYHLFLEAKASEHSARRVAMKTASDNAAELSDDLTLVYNKARQVGITGEIMEITSTMTTLE